MALHLTKNGETDIVDIPDWLSGDQGMALAFAASRMTTLVPIYWENPQAYLTLSLFISQDGGQQWESHGSWGAYGGIHRRKDPMQPEALHSSWARPIPNIKGLVCKLGWEVSHPIFTELFLTLLRTDAMGIQHQQLLGQW